MEMDFMGLNAKVKQETVEDSVYGKGSRCPSPFSSKRFSGACVKPQLLGGNLLLPSTTVAGTTDQWINASEVPAQFTIFYNGTVNVFDNISPEKAETIILLAGKSISSNLAQSNNYVQAPVSVQRTGEPIHAFLDGALAERSMSTPKCSTMPSPISVSLNVAAGNNDDIKVPNTISMSATLTTKVEPPVMVTSPGPTAGPKMLSDVPQARKASLARFLEKRKERAVKAAPYNLIKKEADYAIPESASFGLSPPSGVGSCSASSSKEITG